MLNVSTIFRDAPWTPRHTNRAGILSGLWDQSHNSACVVVELTRPQRLGTDYYYWGRSSSNSSDPAMGSYYRCRREGSCCCEWLHDGCRASGTATSYARGHAQGMARVAYAVGSTTKSSSATDVRSCRSCRSFLIMASMASVAPGSITEIL